MKFFSHLIFLSLYATALSAATPEGESIFNGKDLSGWVVEHGGEWEVEEGVLIGKKGTNWTTNPEKSGSWLRSEKQYGDYVLELEYAINTNGNSGIFFRSGTERNPAFTGYEMQITSDHGRNPTKHSTGAIYDVTGASKNMSKPAGEWNKVRIEARGSKIQIVLNGEKILEVENERSKKGFVGLQNHDARSEVKFRNIRIKEL